MKFDNIFNYLLGIQLAIAIICYGIAKAFSQYVLDILFFALCFSFANIFAVNGYVQTEKRKQQWIFAALCIIIPFINLIF